MYSSSYVSHSFGSSNLEKSQIPKTQSLLISTEGFIYLFKNFAVHDIFQTRISEILIYLTSVSAHPRTSYLLQLTATKSESDTWEDGQTVNPVSRNLAEIREAYLLDTKVLGSHSIKLLDKIMKIWKCIQP